MDGKIVAVIKLKIKHLFASCHPSMAVAQQPNGEESTV